MTVDFFIGGWPKTGSTSLDYYVGQHPEIFMCPMKDSYYFAFDIRADAEASNMGAFYPCSNDADYEELFAGRGEERLVGESSVFYVVSATAPAEIKRANPSAKLILIVRDPVDLIDSWFHYLLLHGREDASSVEQALQLQEVRLLGDKIPANTTSLWHLDYDSLTNFPDGLERVKRHFAHDEIHLILYDDFKNDRDGVVAEVFDFLGVDSSFAPDYTEQNLSRQTRFHHVNTLLKNNKPTIERVLDFPAFRPVSAALRRLYVTVFSANRRREPLTGDTRAALQRRFRPIVADTSVLLDRNLLAEWGYE